MLTVLLCSFLQQIPTTINYQWIIINHTDGIILSDISSINKSYITNFTRTGIYNVTVQGWNFQNSTIHLMLFNATTTIHITEG